MGRAELRAENRAMLKPREQCAGPPAGELLASDLAEIGLVTRQVA